MPKKNSSPKKSSPLNLGMLYTIVSAIIIMAGALVAIQYAKGGLRFTRSGFTAETGLLNANSFPTGAEVYVDGELITATDNTVYLDPGEYLVEVRKEGYSPWRKQLLIQKELVTQTNAQLFPIAPILSPLTLTGATNVTPSPDGQKVVFYTNQAHSETKNGLYLLELSSNFIPLQRAPKLIAEDTPAFDLENAEFVWSPDSAELMILTPTEEVIIEVGNKVVLANQPDISWKRAQMLSEWEEEIYQREREFLREFPEEILEIATESAKNVYLSPDKKRMMYTATVEIELPENLIPPVPASNTQPQSRSLQPNSIYVYDSEEDRNFWIGTETDELTMAKHLLAIDVLGPSRSLESSPSAFARLQGESAQETARRFLAHHTPLALHTVQWFPDSKHILFATETQVHIVEYDGTNDTVVYSGPFEPGFVYPWPDGSKILILTSFSPDSPQNLYAVDLK